MYSPTNGAERINSFAVVTYIPDPLGAFLDRMRRELEPSTLAPRAHVTVLPPRSLRDDVMPSDAWRQIERQMPLFQPFDIRTGHVEVFPTTNVVYISINQGVQDLHRMHDALNIDLLEARESFRYHPHVTLAQGLTPEQAMEIASRAQRRWNEFAESRAFNAGVFTFVQNTMSNRWKDLGEINLGEMAPVRVRR